MTNTNNKPDANMPPGAPAAPTGLRERLLHALARENPNRLLNLFNILVASSFVVILAVAGLAIHTVYSDAILGNAEKAVAGVGKAILSAEVDNLLAETADGALRIAVAPEDMKRMDTQMRRYLRPFGMQKIVVFDADKTVVYSTDNALIGQPERNDAQLDQVIAHARPSSRIVGRAKVGGLDAVMNPGATFVDAFSPIVDAKGRSLGAFEIYVDISHTRDEIVRVMTLSMGILAAVVAVCLFSLYLPMKHGTEKLIAVLRYTQDLATKDPLTGTFNRRYIADHVKQEFLRWNRHEAPDAMSRGLSIVMADIDFFKRINDTHGHGVGDEVLKEVARRLGETLRGYDMLGRYGGEEFLVMLPNTEQEGARVIAERLRWAVGNQPVDIAGGRQIRITMSFGVACATHDEASENEIIHWADKALYQAKTGGRDRVVVYRPETSVS